MPSTMRACFTKHEEVRYLSHLDLARTFERALRRAECPLALTEGFHPRPKLSFASALSLGVTSDKEYMEIELSAPMEPSVFCEKLSANLPEGIRLTSARIVAPKAEALMAIVDVAIYQLDIADDYAILLQRAEELLEKEVMVVVRQTKKGKREVDIRPLLYSIEVLPENPVAVIVTCATGNNGNLRPLEVGEFLSPEGVLRVHRQGLFVRRGQELLSPLEVGTYHGA